MAVRALVIGGTGGIGYAIASHLATETGPSSTITISGRSKPEKMPGDNVQFRQLDASSMRAIKRYAEQLKASEEKLDLLIMSQGILTTAGRAETAEGIDYKMALHYYGKQLLVKELQPVLKDDAKVVIVLDASSGDPNKLNWDDLDLKKSYGLAAAASHCISMTDAMVQYSAAQQKTTESGHRHFIHAAPGVVRTNIGGGMPWYLRSPMRVLQLALGVPPEKYAEHLIHALAEVPAAAEKEGRYWSFIDSKGKAILNKPAWTDEQLEKVADHTRKIIENALKVEE